MDYRMNKAWLGAIAAAFFLLTASPAAAVQCNHTQSFSSWLEQMKQDALAAGVSSGTVRNVLSRVSYDRSIVRRDRSRGVFAQDFLTFSGRMVSGYRLKHGRAKLKQYASLFDRIEKQYGVPGPVIVGFWGLETDFGANSGDDPIIGALATLAYDCRRPEMFREQLIAALKILDRGDLGLNQLIGAWAGELGQTQFLPTHYLEFGTDYDGDGQVNLRKSVPDVLASTAKLISHYGWRRGEPWLEEVTLTRDLPWREAELNIRHPRSQWVEWGVKRRSGEALPADGLPVALLLPMGRHGPAFLAYPNFDVYTQWNQSLVYATTAAYFATRLGGAPRYDRGKPGIPTYGLDETSQLQTLLKRHGYDVGGVDGIMGEMTRQAIRKAQIKYGLPADSYPSNTLFSRLRGG